jgi:hypothetical protein
MLVRASATDKERKPGDWQSGPRPLGAEGWYCAIDSSAVARQPRPRRPTSTFYTDPSATAAVAVRAVAVCHP